MPAGRLCRYLRASAQSLGLNLEAQRATAFLSGLPGLLSRVSRLAGSLLSEPAMTGMGWVARVALRDLAARAAFLSAILLPAQKASAPVAIQTPTLTIMSVFAEGFFITK